MKFTNGFWLLREGVSLTRAVQLQRIDVGSNQVDALVAVKRVDHRGQTLNSPLFTLRITSPAPGVIGVNLAHHLGGRAPIGFQLNRVPQQLVVTETPVKVSITAGDLTLEISRDPFTMTWLSHGKKLAEQSDKPLIYATSPAGKFIGAQLSLGVGEQVYGLGERFTSFIKNGQSVDVYNEDPGTSSEQAYKNIPFYVTNRGYGVFVNHSGRVSFEVGSETVSRVQFTVEDEQVEYFVIAGQQPKTILERYTDLTGKPKLPPLWSFGLWLSTSFVTDYDEQTVNSFISEMQQRDIPLSVFHFDCFWMREYQWCDFEWDPRVFPDPAGMVQRLKERGLRVSLWINPYIGQASPLFAEAKELGYLLKRADGSVWQWDLWQAGNAIVDFTNPGARSWFQGKLRPLLEMGVDCFKTDFGERIPTDVVYHDGSDPHQMHNLYTQLYNQTVYELLLEHSKDDAMVFARSATVGGQTMPVHWGGDNSSSFESMAESLRGGLSLGLGGFGFWSHDIGGFEGKPDPGVFKRWVAFGALSSHSRLHGNESVRVPWEFDEEAVEVTKYFVKLKNRLMPYLYTAAVDGSKRGLPMARAMFLEFPDDRNAWHVDEQYMLGPDLLVAPIMSPDGEKQVYLPVGEWVNFHTGELVSGGVWRTEKHDFFSLPLYVRRGAVLVQGTRSDTVEYDFHTEVEAVGYGLRPGEVAVTQVVAADGSVKTFEVSGAQVA